MTDPNMLILSIFASLCFGFLVGYILRGFFRKKAASEEKGESGMPLEAEDLKKKPQNHQYKEVAQLWFDIRDRKLVFQVGEKYFKHADDMSPKDQAKLLKVVSDFYHWLDPDAIVSRKDPSTSQPTQPGKPGAVFVPAKTMTLMKDENSSKVDLGPSNVLSQALRPDNKQSALSSLSMVAQVDAILQEKLHHAGMKKWAVRLTEFPQQGMVVMVGLEKYNDIDDVPYERVRRIIRESVLEWEQRAEMGGFAQ